MRKHWMKIARRGLLPGLTLLALLGLAPRARAERAPPDKQTQRLFEEANTLLQARNFGEALKRYETAYERYPHPKILLNMGTSLHGLGRNAEALDRYERYLRDPETDPTRKQEVSATMKSLEPQVGRLTIDVSEPGAVIAVDGHVLDKVPGGLRLDPGSHVVTASKEGFLPVKATVSLEAAQVKSIHLALADVRPAHPPAEPPPAPPGSPTPPVPPASPGAAPETAVERPGLASGSEPSTDVELGVRFGYGIPFGTISTGDGNDLGHFTSGAYPIVLDGNVGMTRSLLLGGLFQYASLREGSGCDGCTGSAIRLGVTVAYRMAVGSRASARVGLGAGYEWLSVTGSTAFRWSGLELGRLELGGDVMIARRFTLGPFASFSPSRYTEGLMAGNSPSFHSWLLFGVRAGFSVWP